MTDLIFYLAAGLLLVALLIYTFGRKKISGIKLCDIIGHVVEPIFGRMFCYHCAMCGEQWTGYEELKKVASFNQDKHRRLFFVTLVLLLLTLATTCQSAITPEFLSKVEAIESNGRANAIGDNGRSVGLFQFSRAAWADCSKIRQKQGLSVYPYSNATNAYIARLYAGTWFNYLESRLSLDLKRKPSDAHVFSAHNLGYSRFRDRGFNLQKVPQVTKRNIAKL